MTLSDREVEAYHDAGYLTISNFNERQLQPASYDLLLGDTFLRFSEAIDVTIPWEPQHLWGESIKLTTEDEPFLLNPGEFALGTTEETISLSDKVAAEVWGKSSLGRIGLSIHITAGFVDPGFSGQLTLEFFNLSPVPIALRPKMPICQVVFTRLNLASNNPYSGKYVGQRDVTPGRYYEN